MDGIWNIYICFQNGAAFMIDEVQAGCGISGKMWCHEYFDLPSPPDIMTFSKKMLLGGYYYAPDMRPDQVSNIFPRIVLGHIFYTSEFNISYKICSRKELVIQLQKTHILASVWK